MGIAHLLDEMKKLLLTSNGFINPKIGQEFLNLVSKTPADIKVLFIPTASETGGDFTSYFNVAKKELTDLGILKENITWFNANNPKAVGQLNKYDAVYVCGGNTFYLLYQLKLTGLYRKLISFINSGKVYVGVSAGSVLAGPSILISAPFDSNDIKLEDFTGLGVTSKIICPHYNEKDENLIVKVEKKNNWKVLRLNDGQALEVLGYVSKIIE